MKLAILLVIAFTFAFKTHYQRFEEKELQQNVNANATEKIFLNLVDHFNHRNKKVYAQRYWDLVPDNWSNNVVLLFINGEGPGHFRDDYTTALGQTIGARVISLEHRYYGQSQPHEDWTVPNLRELTHEQGLADVAYFIEKQNQIMGSTKKWIIVGGSYAGAMSAWFRYKYPHLVIGSIASSGVVNAVYDFYKYMEQIYTDLQKPVAAKCLSTILELTQYAMNIIENGNDADKATLKGKFGAPFLNDKDFVSYFTDTYVGYIQYSNRTGMCTMMVNDVATKTNMDQKLAAWAKIGELNGDTPDDYAVVQEAKTVIDFKSSSRQWLYQTCTAFSYFQTGDNAQPLRYAAINMDYYFTICDRAFGVKVRPDTVHTNILMGTVTILDKVSNVMFQNGLDDPWQWCGLRTNQVIANRGIKVTLINCDDCGHCTDLWKPKPTNPQAITDIQAELTQAVQKWISA